MKILYKEPNKKIEIKDIDGELKTLQNLVGGYIETIPYKDNVIILLDEEGRLKDSQPNIIVPIYGDLVGNIVFIGVDGEDFTGLTDNQIEEILNNIR